MLDRSGVDDVDGKAALRAGACGIERRRTRVALRPLREHRDRVFDVEVAAGGVGHEVRALGGVVVGAAVAHRRRRARPQQRAVQGRVEELPLEVRRPVIASGPGPALGPRPWSPIVVVPGKAHGRKGLCVRGLELHRLKGQRRLRDPRREHRSRQNKASEIPHLGSTGRPEGTQESS